MMRYFKFDAPIMPIFCGHGSCFAKDDNNVYLITNDIDVFPRCDAYASAFVDDVVTGVGICKSSIIIKYKKETNTYPVQRTSYNYNIVPMDNVFIPITNYNAFITKRDESALVVDTVGDFGCAHGDKVSFIPSLVPNVVNAGFTKDGEIIIISNIDSQYHVFKTVGNRVCGVQHLGQLGARPANTFKPFIFSSSTGLTYIIIPINERTIVYYQVDKEEVRKVGTLKWDDEEGAVPIAQPVIASDIVITIKDGYLTSIKRFPVY